MKGPIAYFITIATYGTWLPGDQRGWVEHRKGWKYPNHLLEAAASKNAVEGRKILTACQRHLVEQQVHDTCVHRQWVCHAVNCRTNHMHVVVSADDTAPTKVRSDLKAWCTRKLKEHALPMEANEWWAERGSIRWVFDDEGLNQVIRYTLEEQDNQETQHERTRPNT